MNSKLKRTGFVFACVAPAVILFAIFMVWPTFNVFRLSLFQRSTFNPNEVFIGFKNFEMLMKDTHFIRSMQNMLLLIVMVTIFTMGTALIFAGILTREKLKGQDFFRIVFYIPNILSVVVISGIFSAIYAPDNTGMLNSILNLSNVENIAWKSEQHVMTSIVIAMVWQAIG
jgi:N-acetylglucosamine transport system permease protein